MKLSFHPFFLTGLAAVCICLQGCLQWDSNLEVNPDKSGRFAVQVTVDMGAVSALLAKKGSTLKARENSGRDMLVGILSGSEGVDVWTEAKTDTDAKGRTTVTVAGLFKDISQLQISNPLASPGDPTGRVGGGLPSFGRMISISDASGRWILEMVPGSRKEGEDGGGPRKSSLSPEEIDGKVASFRASLANDRAALEALLAGLRLSRRITVGGAIEDPGLFTKADGHTATLEFTAAKLYSGMEAVLKEDALARTAVQYQDFNPVELLDSTDAESKALARKALEAIAGPGEPRIVVTKGRPLFDYATEAAKARAAQSEEVKALLKAAAASKPPSTGKDPSR